MFPVKEPSELSGTDIRAGVTAALSSLKKLHQKLVLIILSDWETFKIYELSPNFFSVQNLFPLWENLNDLTEHFHKVLKPAFSKPGSNLEKLLNNTKTGMEYVLDALNCDLSSEREDFLTEINRFTGTTYGSLTPANLFEAAIIIRNEIVLDEPENPQWWKQASVILRKFFKYLIFFEDIFNNLELKGPWFEKKNQEIYYYNGFAEDFKEVYFINDSGQFFSDKGLLKNRLYKIFRAFLQMEKSDIISHTVINKINKSFHPPQSRIFDKGLVFNHFLIKSKIYENTFMSVYKGLSLLSHKEMILKSFHKKKYKNGIRRFIGGANLLKRFLPEKTVKIYEAENGFKHKIRSHKTTARLREKELENITGNSYIIREYVEGLTLEDMILLLSFNRKFSLTKALNQLDDLKPLLNLRKKAFLRNKKTIHIDQRIKNYIKPDLTDLESRNIKFFTAFFKEAAEALENLHLKNIVHRGIEPGSIYITKALQVVLTECGGYRNIIDLCYYGYDEKSVNQRAVYMAPEQFFISHGRLGIGTHSDIYSLCAVFYKLFTGTQIFKNTQKSPEDLVSEKLLKKKPLRASSVNRAVPWEVSELIQSGLAFSGSKRIKAGSLKNELTRYITKKTLQSSKVPLKRKLALFWLRHRLPVNLFFSVALIVLFAVGLKIYQDQKIPDFYKTTSEYLNQTFIKRQETVKRLRKIKSIRKKTETKLKNLNKRLNKIYIHRSSELLREGRYGYGFLYANEALKNKYNIFSSINAAVGYENIPAFLTCLPDGINHLATAALHPSGTGAALIYHSGKMIYFDTKESFSHFIDHSGINQNDKVFAVFSQKGKYLGVSLREKVLVFDILRGKKLFITNGKTCVKGLNFSPDEKMFAVFYDDNKIVLWKMKNLNKTSISVKRLGAVETPPGTACFSVGPEGKKMALGHEEGNVSLWDFHSNKKIFSKKISHKKINNIKYLQKQGLIIASCSDKSLLLYNVSNEQPVAVTDNTYSAATISFDHTDSKIYFTDFKNHISLYDLSEQKRRSFAVSLNGQGKGVFSAAGKNLFISDQNKTLFFSYRFKKKRSYPVPFILPLTNQYSTVSHSCLSHSNLLLYVNDNILLFTDIFTTNNKIKENPYRTKYGPFSSSLTSITLSPNGRFFSVCEKKLIQVFENKNPEPIYIFQISDDKPVKSAFSPNNRLLSSITEKGHIVIWNIEQGHIVKSVNAHKGRGVDIRFNPQGNKLISSAEDGFVKVWDISQMNVETVLSEKEEFKEGFKKEQEKQRYHQKKKGKILTVAAFLPDKTNAVSASGSTMKIWNRKTGIIKRVISTAPGIIKDLSCSKHKHLITVSMTDGTVMIYNTQTGYKQISFQGTPGGKGFFSQKMDYFFYQKKSNVLQALKIASSNDNVLNQFHHDSYPHIQDPSGDLHSYGNYKTLSKKLTEKAKMKKLSYLKENGEEITELVKTLKNLTNHIK